ncbi:MAG TPA: DEAD/DEAH box helicase, partial [Chloroflexota bacterium]|nr:DEAD/DEAH box helicase [Chloroflexota bacterium]
MGESTTRRVDAADGYGASRDPIALLRNWNGSRGQLVSHRVIPPRLPAFAAPDNALRDLMPHLPATLYRHQAAAMALAARGEHLTLATPTASGKTVALALPGLLARQEDRDARVLCIAPTRALVEQWQERLAAWDPSGPVETYTGDTPKAQRRAIRERARWLVTTPDMLHMGLLPYHMKWHPFLSRLRYVIVDESHVYRGVFGSHMIHVLRRLRRIARAHRAPGVAFLFASATIGNPSDHATALLGLPVTALTESGAPSGERTVTLWQPPDEAGHSDQAAALMAFFLTRGLRTILFGQARQSVERMLRVVRDRVPPELAHRVSSYRAGYMAHERHAIHRRLATGDLLGVVTTNALELGIDIGHLDVSVLDGFPGSVASFWQQAGRAGRGEGSALTVLVLRRDALDQYFAAHPEHLFERPVEHALVNSSNPYILPPHVLCAAYEKPLTAADLHLFGPAARTAATTLVEQGRMLALDGTYRPRGGDNPAYGLSLRQVGERLAIVDAARNAVVEETDLPHAVTECYPGAVYFSQGIMYAVRDQDLGRGQIRVERADVDYYTEPLEWKEVTILAERQRTVIGHADLCVGDVRVTQHVTGFVRR